MQYVYIKRNVEKVWDARYTLGARCLSKNTVLLCGHIKLSPPLDIHPPPTKKKITKNILFNSVRKFEFIFLMGCILILTLLLL
jgi:hypothetical protein